MKQRYLIIATAIAAFIFACASDGGQTTNEGDVAEGKVLYEQYCVLCHGKDGKLAVNGAMDLTESTLTLDERVALMKNGRGLMTPFEGIITEDQMRSIGTYAMTLKTQ